MAWKGSAGFGAAFTRTREFRKLMSLTVYFVLLALVIYYVPLGQASW